MTILFRDRVKEQEITKQVKAKVIKTIKNQVHKVDGKDCQCERCTVIVEMVKIIKENV